MGRERRPRWLRDVWVEFVPGHPDIYHVKFEPSDLLAFIKCAIPPDGAVQHPSSRDADRCSRVGTA